MDFKHLLKISLIVMQINESLSVQWLQLGTTMFSEELKRFAVLFAW